MPYIVTRQLYYYSGERVVEVTAGGIDYAGPDALYGQYEGEWKEYTDPVHAVDAAIEIRRQWKADSGRRVRLTTRSKTAGAFGMEGEFTTEREARRWAVKELAALPRCSRCGELLPEKRDRFHNYYLEDEEFCSEYCAEEAWREYEEDLWNDEE